MSERAATRRRQDRRATRQLPLGTLTVAGISVMVMLACTSIWLDVKPGPEADAVTLAVSGSASHPAASDEELFRMAVGTWQDFFHGKRTLTLNSDGTGMMLVELTGMKARLFTPRLELDIAWSMEGGKMLRRTLGGRPANKVAYVNRRAGVSVAEPIVKLTESQMTLRDQSGKPDYAWQRVR